MRARPQDDASVADRLIDAAEALYGEHGLDGASLRQISLAAGTGNNYAVQYHFGDMDGLIRAVLDRRMPDVERRRAQVLADAKARGRLGDTRALMEILYLPLLDHRNAAGERAYARFVLALMSSPTGVAHRASAFHLMPIADHVVDLIAQTNPGLPQNLLLERQRLVSMMVLTSLFSRRAPWNDAASDAALVDNILDMATAALTAPASPEIIEVFSREG